MADGKTVVETRKVAVSNPAMTGTRQLYRRKPLLVEASRVGEFWTVLEAGRQLNVTPEDFTLLYEMVELDEAKAVDVGLPDMELGTTISRDGQTLVRVDVIAGRGANAYWYMSKPNGEDAGYRVIADVIGDSHLSHYAGKFIVPWEGGVGLAVKRAWVVVHK